jgi:hypothetical protein
MTDDLSLSQAVTKAERWDITNQTQRLTTLLRKPGAVAFTGDPSLLPPEQQLAMQDLQALGQDPATSVCFRCKQIGHFRVNCPELNRQPQRPRTPEGGYNNQSYGNRYPSSDRSYGGQQRGTQYGSYDPYYNPEKDNRSRWDAHNNNGGRGGSSNNYSRGRSGSQTRSGSRPPMNRQRSQSGGRSDSKELHQCSNCTGIGHFSNDCTSPRKGAPPRSGSQTKRTCHSCGKVGHLAAECKFKPGSRSNSKDVKGDNKRPPNV